MEQLRKMDNKGKPMRGVIVFDFEIDGNLMQAAAFDMELKKFAAKFELDLKDKNPELAEKITFVGKPHAGVPMAERRGPTGDIDGIVFRGSRGKNEAMGRATIPSDVGEDQKKHLVALRERLRREKMPTPLIQQEIDKEYAGLKSGSIETKNFRRYTKKTTVISIPASDIKASMDRAQEFQKQIRNGIKKGKFTIQLPKLKFGTKALENKNWEKLWTMYNNLDEGLVEPEVIQRRLEEEAAELVEAATKH